MLLLVPADWQSIFSVLNTLYPNAECELMHANPFQLLIATILSAQCTDQRVNMVTKDLFIKFPRPEDYAALSQAELEEHIKSCGLFRNKAKNIIACCKQLLELHGGEVPQSLAELECLPGVGRKTANVVAYNAFGIPALGVDTHVFRVSRRLGLASGTTPEAVEKELTALLPSQEWGPAHHLLIWHGRRMCAAQRPACTDCPLTTHCLHLKEKETGQ